MGSTARAGHDTGAARAGLSFQPIYGAERLQIVNLLGDVGLITLWSPFRTVQRKLRGEAPELLDTSSSRIAVIANLYGDGMYEMFCNLLANPQVRHLVAVGQDLGLGVCEEIESFLAHGLQDAELLGQRVKRVSGTQRCFPDLEGFDEVRLREQLSFHRLGKLSSPDLAERLTSLVAALDRDDSPARERIRLRTPQGTGPTRRPSRVEAHQVVRERPFDCWRELVVRTLRFGQPVQLAKGARIELANAHALIAGPGEDPPALLAEHGFDIDRFHAYQRAILEPALPEGIAYTYGNRLRDHFQLGPTRDTLEVAISRLRADPATRGAYATLWDNAVDLAGVDHSSSKPCLTTVHLRIREGRMALTATYRAHNLLTAWLENVYGLIAIQRHVAERVGVPCGSISVISHALGIDPASPRFELARAVERGWDSDDDVDRASAKRRLREDPNGYFVVSVDRDSHTIVAEHRFEGVLVKRYQAARAIAIEQQVAADMAISVVSHAMWLGRQLAQAEQALGGQGGVR